MALNVVSCKLGTLLYILISIPSHTFTSFVQSIHLVLGIALDTKYAKVKKKKQNKTGNHSLMNLESHTHGFPHNSGSHKCETSLMDLMPMCGQACTPPQGSRK